MHVIIPLIDAETLRNAVSPEVYVAVFDDLNTGDLAAIDQSGAVQDVIDDANVLVISALPPIYTTIPDGADRSIPILLKSAIRMYLRYYTFMRRPETTRTMGRDWEGMLKQGNDIMERIQAGLLQITSKDSPPEPSPENLGGIVVDARQRMFLDGPSGQRNSGDF